MSAAAAPADTSINPAQKWIDMALKAEEEGDLGKAQYYWMRAYCAERDIDPPEFSDREYQ